MTELSDEKNFLSRLIYSVLTVSVIIIAYSQIFSWSMYHFEDQTVTFSQSLQVVVESLTTSGYGGYSPWQSDFLNYFIVVMNLTGVALVFFAFPVLIVPILKRAIEKSPPKKTKKTDHVLICPYSGHSEVLIQELVSRDKDYVIIEPNEQQAKKLFEKGFNVITGNPESRTVLENANIASATTLVLDTFVEKSISTIFSARNLSKSINIIVVLENDEEEVYCKLAGADATVLPRQLIGESLAKQVPAISIIDSVEIDNDLEVIEIDIEEGSELCNKTIRSSKLLENHQVYIIGAWQKDEFNSPVSPDLVLNSKIRLLVAGDREDIDKLSKKAESRTRHFRRNKVFILGFGQSGKAAQAFLKNRSIDLSVIDIEDHEGVDIVGDITKNKTLQQAEIEDASSVIITIDDDAKEVYSTMMVRKFNKDAHIAVRANYKDNVRNIFDAGADYVQAVTTVGGRMLAAAVFDDEDSIAAEKQINLVQLPAGKLAGSTLTGSDVRAETGCTILMAMRNGEKIPSPDPESFVFQEGDQVVMAGTDESIRQYEGKYLSQ